MSKHISHYVSIPLLDKVLQKCLSTEPSVLGVSGPQCIQPNVVRWRPACGSGAFGSPDQIVILQVHSVGP